MSIMSLACQQRIPVNHIGFTTPTDCTSIPSIRCDKRYFDCATVTALLRRTAVVKFYSSNRLDGVRTWGFPVSNQDVDGALELNAGQPGSHPAILKLKFSIISTYTTTLVKPCKSRSSHRLKCLHQMGLNNVTCSADKSKANPAVNICGSKYHKPKRQPQHKQTGKYSALHQNVPIVEINVELKASSENLKRTQVFPTPESPIKSNLNK